MIETIINWLKDGNNKGIFVGLGITVATGVITGICKAVLKEKNQKSSGE